MPSGWKGDLDAQPAFGAGVELERAAVSVGDRGDDRQAEPVAVLRAGASAPRRRNGCASCCDVVGVEQRAAALDDEPRARRPATAVQSAIEPSGWLWRTAFSITFSTMRASSVALPATRACGSGRCSTFKPLRRRSASARSSIAAHASSARESVAWSASGPCWARASARKLSSSASRAVELAAQPFGELTICARAPGPGLAIATSSDVRIIASGVRSSCEALATNRRSGVERSLEPVEQLVDRVGQLSQLVVGAGEVQPLVQGGGGDLSCCRRDRPQRPQDPPGHEPTEPQRKRAHHGQCDARRDEQLSPVDAVLARRDQYAPGGRRQRHGGPAGPPEPHHDGDRQQHGACSEEGGEDDDGEPRSDRARGQVESHVLA